MNEGNTATMPVQALIDQFRQEPTLWWGRSPEDGWVVLDRTDPRNRDGEMRHLVRCRDWQRIRVTRKEFGGDRFQGLANHVGSLTEQEQRDSIDRLLQIRGEFLSQQVKFHSLTEEDWLTGSVPQLLAHSASLPGAGLSHLWADKGRKQLLLASSIARMYWPKLNKKLRKQLETLEAATDNPDRKKSDPPAVELKPLEDAVVASLRTAGDWPVRQTSMADVWVLFVGSWRELNSADRGAPEPSYDGWEPLIRDVFGNPFRPIVLDPACRPANVVALAQAAYNDPILPEGTLSCTRLSAVAAALEEAGCGERQILGHLRAPGPHVRGCWALDLVLGKE